MIELQRHIEILLLESDCVIVPDFGGFMAHQVSAHYNDGDGLFLPPSRTIGFNPQLRLNDSLLAQSFIEAYDISYPEAMRRIESEVDELHRCLTDEGVFVFENIGTITVNADGNYEFTPCEAGILSPEYYGLGATLFLKRGDVRQQYAQPEESMQNAEQLTVQLAEDSEFVAASDEHATGYNEHTAGYDEHADTAESTEAAATADAQQDTDTDAEMPTAALIDFDDDDDSTVTIKWSWIRSAVAIAAAVAAFFLLETPIANSNTDSIAMHHLSSHILYKLMPKDSNIAEAVPVQTAETTAAMQEDEATAKATDASQVAGSPSNDETTTETPSVAKANAQATTPKAQTATPKAQTGDKPYTIVLASQVRKDRAEEFAADLKNKGYADARVYIYNNVVRVVCGSFVSEEDARKQLHSIHQVDGLEDAWIYKMPTT